MKRNLPFVPACMAALMLAVGASATTWAQTTAVTQTNPTFPGSSVDDVRVGDAGSYPSIPLPTGLEFPWDVDIFGDRLFVVGAGQDDGTTAPGRQFNTDGRGQIWSMDLDGSNPTQHASGLDFPQFLDVAPGGSTVYFTQQGTGSGVGFGDNGRISRLDVLTNNIVDVVTAPVDAGPTGIDYDPDTNSIFYQVNNRGSNVAMQQIRRVDASTVGGAAGSDELWLENPTPLDGTLDSASEFTVVSAGRNLEVQDGFLYWTYRNGSFAPPSEIRRLPLSFDIDTDDPESFETLVTGQRILDFQFFDDQLIWTDTDQGAVFQANADGTGSPSVVATAPGFNSLPIGVAAQSSVVIPTPAAFAAGLAMLAGRIATRRRRRA